MAGPKSCQSDKARVMKLVMFDLTHFRFSSCKEIYRNYETDMEKKNKTEFHFIYRAGLHHFSLLNWTIYFVYF